MTHKDTKLHLAYFRDIKKKKLGQDFWCNDIAFYFNGVDFEFKTNPLDRVRTASKRIAETNRRLGHQLCREREKRGVRQCQIHGWHFTWKECIFCKQYFGAISGLEFRSIMRSTFKSAFIASGREDKCVLKNRCPRQNAAVARRFWDQMGCELVSIPSRSPDLNTIESFFNLVKMRLKQETIDKIITKGNFEEFSERVQECVFGFRPEAH